MAPSRVRIPPSPLAQRPPRLCAHPRRGGRAVECGGLENRYPSLGGSRVQIPPPPPPEPNPMRALLLQLVTDHVSKVAVPYTLLARLAYPGRQAIPSIPERSWSTRFRCVPSASAIHASAAPPYRGPDV